jgi:hypothetical protein
MYKFSSQQYYYFHNLEPDAGVVERLDAGRVAVRPPPKKLRTLDAFLAAPAPAPAPAAPITSMGFSRKRALAALQPCATAVRFIGVLLFFFFFFFFFFFSGSKDRDPLPERPIGT